MGKLLQFPKTPEQTPLERVWLMQLQEALNLVKETGPGGRDHIKRMEAVHFLNSIWREVAEVNGAGSVKEREDIIA